jgi:hypothetical protein
VERCKVQHYLITKAKLQGQIDFLNSIAVPNSQQSAAHAIQLLEQSQSNNANLNKNLSHLLAKYAELGDEWEKKVLEFGELFGANLSTLVSIVEMGACLRQL